MRRRKQRGAGPGSAPAPAAKGTAERALAEAVRILGRGELSASRLGVRLLRRGHSDTSVDRALRELQARGWLDDRRLAAEHLRRGAEVRRIGSFRLAAELRRLGIPGEVIREEIGRHRREVDEDRVLAAALERYQARRGSWSTEAEARRGFRHLLRLGFSPAAVRRVAGAHPAGPGERPGGKGWRRAGE